VGTSPSQRFHVIGGASTNPSILLAETGGSSLQIVSGASDSFIGTNGATPLRLGTGFTERLRITSAGLVGVGTSSPVATNHIRGSGTSGQVTASWLLENFSSGTAGMDITGAAGSSIWRFLYGGGPSTGTNALTPALTIGVEGAAAGRVGIGTSVPKALLNLVGGPVLTQNIPYAINQDAAYLIAGTTGYTGATTSIDTYGLQHRFKVNSAGVSRVTVDRENGELFSINDQGRVGIGSTAPQHKLQVSSGSLCVDGFSDSANAYISLREGFSPSSVGGVGFRAIDHIDGNADGLGCYGQDGISFYTFANERARIDSSGRLLVGTSSAANGPIYALDTGNGRDISGELSATNQFGFRFVTYKARGSAGSRSIVSNNDELGSYVCFGYDGSSFLAGAQIQAFVDGTPSANDMPSRLVFSTTKDGSASPTLRTLINNQGSHYVVSETTGLFVITTLAAGTANYLYLGYSDGVAGNISSGTYQYGVFTNGNVVNTNGSYTAISDVKLKENIVNASSQWDDLKAIQIRNWNFKEETGHETHRQIGPIAQELEAICPGLVFETLDRDEKGNKTGEVTKGVNQSVLYMKAVKALQEAMERIETLEQRLNDAGIN
jgi:hypothetical protein